MRCTEILYPLGNETSPTVAKSSKELWKSIKNKLNDLKEGEDITYLGNTVIFKLSNHLLEKKSK